MYARSKNSISSYLVLCHLVVLSLTSFSLCGIKCYLPSLLLVGADQPGGLEELSPPFTDFSP